MKMYLSDCFMKLVAYVTSFLKSIDSMQPSFESVHGEITKLLQASEDCMKRGEVSREDYDQARFAVCAWIDEAIIASRWDGATEWLREQLQRVYYNTTDAGEKFFDRLNSLGAHQREVREVYYLCLALGFRGRYFNDEYGLEQLKTSNLKLLMGSSIGLPSLERVELFPEGYPAGEAEKKAKRPSRFSWLTITCAAAPAVLFVVLFIIYYFILDKIGGNFLRMVSN